MPYFCDIIVLQVYSFFNKSLFFGTKYSHLKQSLRAFKLCYVSIKQKGELTCILMLGRHGPIRYPMGRPLGVTSSFLWRVMCLSPESANQQWKTALYGGVCSGTTWHQLSAWWSIVWTQLWTRAAIIKALRSTVTLSVCICVFTQCCWEE